MSRSRKKRKIHGFTTAASEKWDKEKANRKLRRPVREGLKRRKEDLPGLREISNVWSFAKYGKRYFHGSSEKIMRK